jgi:hypothetical protein
LTILITNSSARVSSKFKNSALRLANYNLSNRKKRKGIFAFSLLKTFNASD